MQIRQMIDEYIQSQRVSEREKQKMLLVLGHLEQEIKHHVLQKGRCKVAPLLGGEEQSYKDRQRGLIILQDGIDEVLRKETRDKDRVAQRMRGLLNYLNNQYKLALNIDEMLPPIFSYQMERQLSLLKALHKPCSIQELAEQYKVSERTIREDLGKLENEKSLYGQPIQIKRIENRPIAYQSTVHPVFLALNLSEVYALTIGLRQLGAHTPMASTYTYLAQVIYNQLSEYGQEKITKRGEELGLYFEKDSKYRGYRKEEAMKRDHLLNAILYAFKSGISCIITYEKEGEEKIMKGIVQYQPPNDVLIIGEGGEKTCIQSHQLLNIEIDYA